MTEEQKYKVNLFKKLSDNIKYYFIETDLHINLYKNTNMDGHINNQSITLEKEMEKLKIIYMKQHML